MDFDAISTATLPIWWAGSFIVAALLFRYIRKRVSGGAKRILFYLLIIVFYAFFSFMPLQMMFVTVPAVVVLAFIPFRNGLHHALTVILLALVLGGALSYLFYRFSADRLATADRVRERFSRGIDGWDERLAVYIGQPIVNEPSEPLARNPITGKEQDGRESLFEPRLNEELTDFSTRQPATLQDMELAIPVPDGLVLRVENSGKAGAAVLFFANPEGDVMMVALYGKGSLEEVLESCRRTYASPATYLRDLDVLREFFAEPDFQTSYLGQAEIAQNTADAIVASSMVNLAPRDKSGNVYGFGYDVDMYSGAVEIQGQGVRLLMVSAFGNYSLNAELPLLWLRRLLDTNVPEPTERTAG